MSKKGEEDRCVTELGKTFSTCTKLECHETSLKCRLVDNRFCLADVFEKMNEAKEKIGFKSFAVQQTSLEQVFIQMASDQEPDQLLAGEIAEKYNRVPTSTQA